MVWGFVTEVLFILFTAAGDMRRLLNCMQVSVRF